MFGGPEPSLPALPEPARLPDDDTSSIDLPLYEEAEYPPRPHRSWVSDARADSEAGSSVWGPLTTITEEPSEDSDCQYFSRIQVLFLLGFGEHSRVRAPEYTLTGRQSSPVSGPSAR